MTTTEWRDDMTEAEADKWVENWIPSERDLRDNSLLDDELFDRAMNKIRADAREEGIRAGRGN